MKSLNLLNIINPESFEIEFLANKSSIHKDLLKNIKIGVITREHTCLYGNLNYFNFINKNKISKKSLIEDYLLFRIPVIANQ